MKKSYLSVYFVKLMCIVFLFSSNILLANPNDTNGYQVFSSGIVSDDEDGTINYSPTIYKSIIPLKVTTEKGIKICTGVAVSDSVVLTAPLCVSSDDVKSVQAIKTSDAMSMINSIQPVRIYKNSLYKPNNNLSNALVVLVFNEGSFSDFIEIAPGLLNDFISSKNKDYNVTYIGFGGSTSENHLSLKVKKATVNKIYNNSYVTPSRIGGFESVKNGIKTTQKFIVEPSDIGSPLLINGKVVGITSTIHTSKNKTTNQDVTYPVWTYINDYSNSYNNNNYYFLSLELHNLASIAGITPGIRMVEFLGMVKVLSLHPRYAYGPYSVCDNCNLKVNDTITGLTNSHDKNKKIYFISPIMKFNSDYLEYIARKNHADTIDLMNPQVVYKESALPIQTIKYIWNKATYEERKNIPWILNQSSNVEKKQRFLFAHNYEDVNTRKEYANHIIGKDYFRYVYDYRAQYYRRIQNEILENKDKTDVRFLQSVANSLDTHRLDVDCKTLPNIDNKDLFYNRVLSNLHMDCKSEKYTPIQCRLKKPDNFKYDTLDYPATMTPNKKEFLSNNIDLLLLTCSDNIKKPVINTHTNMKCTIGNIDNGKLQPGYFLDEEYGRLVCDDDLIPSTIFINQIIDF